MDTLIGLDLGQLVDFTAAAVIRRSLAIDPRGGLPERDHRGRPCYRFDVAALKRYPLGTSYTSVVAHVVEQLRRPEMGRRPRLVIDGTGVGVAVVEMFRRALRPYADRIECHAITITSGRAWSVVGPNTYHVAKIEIVGAIREALESGRLKLPKGLPDGDLLKRELQDFKVKITDSANETFNAREGAHDDIVLATALPIWLAGLPRHEMRTEDLGGRPSNRGRVHEAIAREAELIEIEEAEALARERGVLTPRLAAERGRLAALAEADEWHPDLWDSEE